MPKRKRKGPTKEQLRDVMGQAMLATMNAFTELPKASDLVEVTPLSHAATEVQMNDAEAKAILEDVLDTLVEVGNGTTDAMLHAAADKLFKLRDGWMNGVAQKNVELREQLRYLFYYRFPLGTKMEDELRERGEHERCKRIFQLLEGH